MKQVHVDVWSDFVCPWCWIAKRRLQKVVEQLKGTIDVRITQKSYRLAPAMAPDDFMTAIERKLGSATAAARMLEAVEANAVKEGLVYNFSAMRFGDTLAAHVLIKSSPDNERHRLVERLFAAYTTEGQNIFDTDVLRTLAREEGMSTKIDFDSREIAATVARDEMEANRFGLGVPLFIFNDRLYLSGARELGTFEKAVLQAASEPIEVAEDSATPSCDIDGCN